MKNRILTTTLIILTISLTFGLAMFGLNFITGPMIEANNAGAELAPLLAVMPEGAEFGGDALIYDSANASASTLKNIPASVLSVYKEKNGLGFAIRTTANSGYTTSNLVMTIGVTADGKICGLQIDSYGDESGSNWNNKLTDAYLGTYLGKDSALAGVELIGGVTYSSEAFKNAVSEALGALIANDLITAGVKSDAQVLEELIATVTTFGKLSEVTTPGGNIQKALKALNNAGFAYIMTEGETSYLAVVNAVGVCKIYNVEGTDVTADHESLVTEAQAASAGQKSYVDDLTTKLGKIMENIENVTPASFDTFGNVVCAVSFQSEGVTYYAFYSTPVTYDNNLMSIVTILDENGAIVKQDIATILYGHGVEYLPVYGQYGDPTKPSYGSYEDLFSGMTSGTLNDSVLISGATISSTAIKTATADVFAAFESIISNEGGEQ